MRKKLIFFIMPIILFCVILNFYLFYIILNKYNLYAYVSDTLQFRFDFIQYAVASIFFTFIFTCIMVIFKLNFIINPIKKLTNTATKIALGQYEKRIEFYEADEIGQLSHSFNLMASRLEETIKDLNDKKNKLYSILNSMDDGVIFVDTEKNIVLINPAAKEIFNVKGETKNRYILEVIRDSRIYELINNPDEMPVEIIMHGEKERILQVKSISVSDYGTGNIIGVLLVIHDVTKIKALENMRSEFVANVSHELKTPLTSIKGFAETLKYVEDKETRDKFLDIIYVESERLSRLINDILTLSELENKDYAINFQKVCLNECITEVYYIMERISLEKNIRLSIDSCEEQLFIYGDRDKFKQMIINLVDNAIKYTPPNGEVNLKLEKYDNNARIEVRDTGIGISKKHLPRLFERFYRVDKARSRSMGGTGLGLAIVKHIVLMFKGDIYVDSEVNKGTTFTIILPLFENK